MIKIMKSYFPENQRPFNEWADNLPIPWDLKKVEESDRKYIHLKAIRNG